MTIADRVATDVADALQDQPMSVEDSLDARRVAERVGVLLGEIGKIADPRLAERTEDLVSLLMQFYGAGIRRILETADEANMLEGRLLDGLIKDELVSSILVIHDLHPLDLPTRVQDALDRVRPYLGSHGGGVEIAGIEGDVVRLTMEGSCSTCPSSEVTLNYAIEKAILDAAPEISRIQAENVEPVVDRRADPAGQPQRYGQDRGGRNTHRVARTRVGRAVRRQTASSASSLVACA